MWKGCCWTNPPPLPEDSVWSKKDIWSRSGFLLGQKVATGRYSLSHPNFRKGQGSDEQLICPKQGLMTLWPTADSPSNSQFLLLCRVWWWTTCTRRLTWYSWCMNTSSLCCMKTAVASTRDTECSECLTHRCSAVHPSASTVSQGPIPLPPRSLSNNCVFMRLCSIELYKCLQQHTSSDSHSRKHSFCWPYFFTWKVKVL